jgi:glycerol kinase
MILSIDQSTSGTKMLLFGPEGELLRRSYLPHRQIIDENGWVEHDPDEIFENVLQLAREMAKEATFAPLALGISNQRETVVAWDRRTGKPLYNAIVWQCQRGAAICEALAQKGYVAIVKEETGLPLSPYFSAAKFAWLLQNIPEVKAAAQAKTLCLGTVDTWLLFRLTQGASFQTDCSNASRTQLMSLRQVGWSQNICELFGIPMEALPEIRDSNALFGQTDFSGILPRKIPIHAMLGDSNAALFGQGCHRVGTGKVTLGTGSSIMINTGNVCLESRHGLATSIAWGLDGKAEYVLEGNVNYAGAIIDWMANTLHLLPTPSDAQHVAAKADLCDTTYLVPAFSGLGAPYWDSDARAAIVGMNRNTGPAELVNAGLESIAYQIYDIVAAMDQDLGAVQMLHADGGPTRNALLMQFLSDMLNKDIQVSAIEELSSSGSAYMAGIAVGCYEAIRLFGKQTGRCFTPSMPPEQRQRKLQGWRAALKQVCKSR